MVQFSFQEDLAGLWELERTWTSTSKTWDTEMLFAHWDFFPHLFSPRSLFKIHCYVGHS